MTIIGDEIIVDWSNGNIRQLIEHDQWQSFSPRQKEQWLLEMNAGHNVWTQVRLQLSSQLAELFFKRHVTGDIYSVAGKWVRLLHFQDVVDEARKFI